MKRRGGGKRGEKDVYQSLKKRGKGGRESFLDEVLEFVTQKGIIYWAKRRWSNRQESRVPTETGGKSLYQKNTDSCASIEGDGEGKRGRNQIQAIRLTL